MNTLILFNHIKLKSFIPFTKTTKDDQTSLPTPLRCALQSKLRRNSSPKNGQSKDADSTGKKPSSQQG